MKVRDWVIGAFNRNLPYDQFVIQQLAGDLLPQATNDQIVASGFNRAHVTTSEGGSIDEEVYVRNVDDRVDTTGTVFFGMTIGCARCHDHKYDPVTSKEYYSLFGFFNSLDENPLDGNAARHPPIVQVPSAEQQAERARIDKALAEARGKLDGATAKVAYDGSTDAAAGEFVVRQDLPWVDDSLPEGARPDSAGLAAGEAWKFVGAPDHPVQHGQTAIRQSVPTPAMVQQFFTSASRPLELGEGDTLYAYVFIDPVNPPEELMVQFHTDAWKHRAYWGQNKVDFGADNTTERLRIGDLPTTAAWVRLEVPAAKLGLGPGSKITGWAITQFGGTAYWDNLGAFTYTPQGGRTYSRLVDWVRDQNALKLAGLPQPIQDVIRKPRDQRGEPERKQLRDYFVQNVYAAAAPELKPLAEEVARLEKSRADLEAAIPVTLVSHERDKPRDAFLLDRGEYDRRKDKVERVTPAFLPAMPPDLPRNRLGFAQWLVSAGHPLTSRVAVNRFWQQVFGTGIVRTAEDFGLQGEPPSHPELLDWLAVEFREGGWNVKALMKLMVSSAAYRQCALANADKLQKDPANRLLARGPRYRLDAETLRDQALFDAGLLQGKIGGPSVKPPQPAGLWEAVAYTSSNTARFVADTGPEKVHRRSLYTFWKRTSAPPQMTTFDAPSRESCIVRRERTNTPLQALLLMNEPQFVESARGLAQRALKEGGTTADHRLVYLFRLATSRQPEPAELAELRSALNDFESTYRANAQAAAELIAVGETRPEATVDPAELAAWTMIGNLVLNLDESLNK